MHFISTQKSKKNFRKEGGDIGEKRPFSTPQWLYFLSAAYIQILDTPLPGSGEQSRSVQYTLADVGGYESSNGHSAGDRWHHDRRAGVTLKCLLYEKSARQR